MSCSDNTTPQNAVSKRHALTVQGRVTASNQAPGKGATAGEGTASGASLGNLRNTYAGSMPAHVVTPEKEKEKAFAVNADGVAHLAKACKEFNAILIHVSTDYVFDGETNLSYSEDDFTNPIGVYGESKLKGEELALDANPKTIILRTSWLYSEFNKNFVKTMLHLFSQKEELGIVADQFGQPTNANDLAEAIMEIIETPQKSYGVFHFSNYPETTWFAFARKIAEFSKSDIKLNPLTTDQYPTPAKRPKRSTMCLDKIEEIYKIEPKHWENSLEECINILAQ